MSDKKQEKKEAIMQAALQLFSSNGFHKTTIPDIAKKLGMSVGNLYNYFSSKDLLAQEIIRYTSEILGREIRRVNETQAPVKEKINKSSQSILRRPKNVPK